MTRGQTGRAATPAAHHPDPSISGKVDMTALSDMPGRVWLGIPDRPVPPVRLACNLADIRAASPTVAAAHRYAVTAGAGGSPWLG